MDITINFTSRPWGNYIKLFQEAGVWVKRVEVNSGERLSLQKHAYRSEKWNIVSGQGLVTINGQDKKIRTGEVIDVPVGTIHRISNIGKNKLIFIEVAVHANGGELSEKDITRIEDDYARDTGAPQACPLDLCYSGRRPPMAASQPIHPAYGGVRNSRKGIKKSKPSQKDIIKASKKN